MTPGMSKTDAQTELVPRLRFPEFQEGNAWEQKSLGALTVPVTERVGDSDCVPHTVTSGKGLISQEEKYGRTIAGKSLKNYYRLQRNDFAFNKSATKVFPQGYIACFQGNERAAVPNSIFSCFRIADENVDAAYLDYLFQGNLHGRWLKDYITVGARAHGALNISDDDLYALPVPLPAGDKALAEQQKIADCLGSLDEWIAAERRKLAALRDHKKGLMQQLFPREGETRPRLRFPEFQDAPEWNVVPLRKLLARDPQYGVNAAAVPFSEESPVYIRITDIDDDGRYLPEGRVSVDIEATDDDYLQEGDIVLARTGASVGKSYRYRPEDGRLVFAGFLIRVRPKRRKLDSRFLAAYLSTAQYWDWVRITSTRSGQPGINGSEYASMHLPIPPDDDSKGEQQKIADCLTALDTRIAAQAEKLDALGTHKRGLMQQLFPSPEGAAS